MKTRRRNPKKQLLCRVGLSLLLGSLISSAHAEVEPSIHDHPDRGCGAMPLGIEMAPELLALANWPLDEENSHSGECRAKPESVAIGVPEAAGVAEPPLPPPMEIEVSPVIRVVAYGAEEEAPAAVPQVQRVAIVSPEDLDDVRGGFELPDLGLKFSFGIEQAVFLNGQLVASTVLNAVDLQKAMGMTASTATTPGGTNPVPPSSPQPSVPGGIPATTVPTTPVIIQNGSGNGFPVQLGPDLTGTVVQNSLNDQQIKTITTISGTINSAQILRALNLQSAIQDGLIGSLRR